MDRVSEILKELEENLVRSKELEEEYRQLIKKNKEKSNPYWSEGEDVSVAQRYKCISHNDVEEYWFSESALLSDEESMLKSANLFKDGDYANFIFEQQNLMREMDRFSKENGGNDIDWDDGTVAKWYIYYSHKYDRVNMSFVEYVQAVGQVYFISEKVARQSIDKFGDRIKELYTRGD